jgi:methylated-DNA-[protein]-cysteine S-methyltransferase
MESHFYCNVTSPVGELLLLGNGEALTGLYMQSQGFQSRAERERRRDPGAFKPVREQLSAYFGGELKAFSLKLDATGTDFQKRVWRALVDIPYGRTESYGALARRIGCEGAARAVGLANGRNPLGIIVPCHRVIGANGALTGYAGGLSKKRWLLAHEARAGAAGFALVASGPTGEEMHACPQ